MTCYAARRARSDRSGVADASSQRTSGIEGVSRRAMALHSTTGTAADWHAWSIEMRRRGHAGPCAAAI